MVVVVVVAVKAEVAAAHRMTAARRHSWTLHSSKRIIMNVSQITTTSSSSFVDQVISSSLSYASHPLFLQISCPLTSTTSTTNTYNHQPTTNFYITFLGFCIKITTTTLNLADDCTVGKSGQPAGVGLYCSLVHIRERQLHIVDRYKRTRQDRLQLERWRYREKAA